MFSIGLHVRAIYVFQTPLTRLFHYGCKFNSVQNAHSYLLYGLSYTFIMEVKLQARIKLYKDRERRHKKVSNHLLDRLQIFESNSSFQEIEEYKRRILSLQNAIRELTIDNFNGEEHGASDAAEDEEMTLEDEKEEGEEKEEDLPQPVFDDEDNIFRCSICGWEVIEGQCQAPACAQEHAFIEVRSTLVVKCPFHKYSVGDGRIGMHRKSSY